MQTRTRFSKFLALLVVATPLGLGGSARAMEEGEPAKHAEEMAKGKNHEAAAEAAKSQ
jgi:hypothetical protein